MYNKGETRFKQTRADITCKKLLRLNLILIYHLYYHVFQAATLQCLHDNFQREYNSNYSGSKTRWHFLMSTTLRISRTLVL